MVFFFFSTKLFSVHLAILKNVLFFLNFFSKPLIPILQVLMLAFSLFYHMVLTQGFIQLLGLVLFIEMVIKWTIAWNIERLQLSNYITRNGQYISSYVHSENCHEHHLLAAVVNAFNCKAYANFRDVKMLFKKSF